MSSPPSAATAVSISRPTSAASARSAAIGTAPIAAAALSSASRPRALIATRQPSAASFSAQARPNPALAAVTSARLPSSIDPPSCRWSATMPDDGVRARMEAVPSGAECVFPQPELDARLARLRAAMAAKQIELLLVSGAENVFYLSGQQTPGYYTFQCLAVPLEG